MFFSKAGWKQIALEVAKEAIAASVALLLVASFVIFFYLYCLPWVGVH